MTSLFREPRVWLAIPVLIAVVAVPRLLLLPFNENMFGDAISRTEMGERWMTNPHVITAFGDGAGQYGPFHIYLIGLATAVVDREIAGRLISLLCALFTVVPLYRLARRLGGPEAGALACLSLAVWGLHIQFSTTAASEALGILLIVCTLDALSSALDGGSWFGWMWAALWMNLAMAVRYDAWMYPPLITLAVVATRGDRWQALPTLIGFGAACAAFPVLWMLGNYRMHGDPTYPLSYINLEHRDWVARDYSSLWSELWLRSQGVVFWPAMAVMSLTPGIAAFAAAGAVAVWRERPAFRWLILVACGPLLYYGVRIAILVDFAPLTRFMAAFLTVMLLFVKDGYLVAVRWWGRETTRQLVKVSVALAIAMPIAIGAFTFRQDGYVRNLVRTLSPTSTHPRTVMAAADFARTTVGPVRTGLLMDVDSWRNDLAVVFYGQLLQEQVIRIKSPEDLARVEQRRPSYAVRFDGGLLLRQPGVRMSGATLRVGSLTYEELQGFGAPVHVYRLR